MGGGGAGAFVTSAVIGRSHSGSTGRQGIYCREGGVVDWCMFCSVLGCIKECLHHRLQIDRGIERKRGQLMVTLFDRSDVVVLWALYTTRFLTLVNLLLMPIRLHVPKNSRPKVRSLFLEQT